jgi:hypothetical protein
MVDFTVDGIGYRTRLMSGRTQFHVARKLAGVMAPMVGSDSGPRTVMDAFANMEDAAADFVLDRCLAVVERQDPGTQTWAPVMTADGSLMFADLESNLAAQMQMVWPVLKENVQAFLSALPKDLSEKLESAVAKLSS